MVNVLYTICQVVDESARKYLIFGHNYPNRSYICRVAIWGIWQHTAMSPMWSSLRFSARQCLTSSPRVAHKGGPRFTELEFDFPYPPPIRLTPNCSHFIDKVNTIGIALYDVSGEDYIQFMQWSRYQKPSPFEIVNLGTVSLGLLYTHHNSYHKSLRDCDL